MPTNFSRSTENNIKTGDLVFVSQHKHGITRIVDLGLAVWIRDPLYTSKLFFVSIKNRRVCMTSLSGVEGRIDVLRPEINFNQIHMYLLEKSTVVLDSTAWILDGLNKFSLMLGDNYTPETLFTELTRGFNWPVVKV